MFTISHGNAFDGINLHGLFTDRMDAVRVAEDGSNGFDDWNIVEVQPQDMSQYTDSGPLPELMANI